MLPQAPFGLLGPLQRTQNPMSLLSNGGYNMNDPSHLVGSVSIQDLRNGTGAVRPIDGPRQVGHNMSKFPGDWAQRLMGSNKEGTPYGANSIVPFLQHMDPMKLQRLIAAGHVPNDWASQFGVSNPQLPNGSMPGGMGNPLPMPGQMPGGGMSGSGARR